MGIICAGLASDLAEKKGYSSGAWGACGFFFGILGLIAAVGLPLRKDSSPCPACLEPIKTEAKVCRYCGQKFSEEELEKALPALISALADGELRDEATADLIKIGKLAIPYLEEAMKREKELFIRKVIERIITLIKCKT